MFLFFFDTFFFSKKKINKLLIEAKYQNKGVNPVKLKLSDSSSADFKEMYLVNYVAISLIFKHVDIKKILFFSFSSGGNLIKTSPVNYFLGRKNFKNINISTNIRNQEISKINVCLIKKHNLMIIICNKIVKYDFISLCIKEDVVFFINFLNEKLFFNFMCCEALRQSALNYYFNKINFWPNQI